MKLPWMTVLFLVMLILISAFALSNTSVSKTVPLQAQIVPTAIPVEIKREGIYSPTPKPTVKPVKKVVQPTSTKMPETPQLPQQQRIVQQPSPSAYISPFIDCWVGDRKYRFTPQDCTNWQNLYYQTQRLGQTVTYPAYTYQNNPPVIQSPPPLYYSTTNSNCPRMTSFGECMTLNGERIPN